jgi:hypothetical protein
VIGGSGLWTARALWMTETDARASGEQRPKRRRQDELDDELDELAVEELDLPELSDFAAALEAGFALSDLDAESAELDLPSDLEESDLLSDLDSDLLSALSDLAESELPASLELEAPRLSFR